MGRDLRGTKAQEELFVKLGDMENPTAHLFADLFAKFKDRDAAYYVDDIIEIGPKQSPYVKNKSITTVGIYILNKFLIEDFQVFGYINKTFTQSVWETLESSIAAALVANDIKQEQVCKFIDKSQYLLGGPLAHIINPSLSSAILSLPPKATKTREKMVKENEDGLKSNDPQVSTKIERAVVKEALEEMDAKHDPCLAFFESGAIDPYNNYKTMFVMKGAIKDNTGESPTGYKIVQSNYNDGITKEDMPVIADSLVTSAYNKGVSTQDSGTLGKKYNAVFQRVRLQEAGTDCGTKKYLFTKITKRHLYRYIVEGGKLVLLTDENIDKYIGKVCALRSPIHCHAPDPQYCNICVGERPYRTDNYNIGLTFNIVSGSTLNASMKSFHDVTIKYYHVTIDDLMKYVK